MSRTRRPRSAPPSTGSPRRGEQRLRPPLPVWLRGYRRAWLRPDAIAGLVVWSVVTPQAVAYAQVAGLPPAAGLMAAPGALLGYALLGTSRQLVVSATTASAAVSAAAIGPLAAGDMARFATLSAALAIVTAVVMAAAGVLKLGVIADFISKPVMTGFLFGLGLVIALGQLPKLLGVPAGEGNFIPALVDLLGELGDVHGTTLVVGLLSAALLVAGRRLAPGVPATLLVLILAIAASAALDLHAHGVAVVGHIPDALPDIGVPDVDAGDLAALVAPALGVLITTAEGIGVARSLAVKHGYRVDTDRDLIAIGGSNLLSGLSSGFVQAGGASQTAAADGAGGRTQLSSVVAAVLVLITGAFLAPLFQDLPEATLAAIVIVAVSGFWDVAALRRMARIRRSAIVFAGTAIAGVLLLGVLPGLIVTATLTLVYVLRHLSRREVAVLATEPVLVVRPEGGLVYPNDNVVSDRVVALAAGAEVVVLDLSLSADLDVQSADMLAELATRLRAQGAELRLRGVHTDAFEILRRSGVTDRMRVERAVDDAVR